MSAITTDDLIAQLKITPETFDVFGLKAIFAVSPDADPVAVRDAGNVLMDLVDRIAVDLCAAGGEKSDQTLVALLQFVSAAAKAAYLSLVGQS
jgi:hypothetical protein